MDRFTDLSMFFPSKSEEWGLDTRAFNNECAEGKNYLSPAPLNQILSSEMFSVQDEAAQAGIIFSSLLVHCHCYNQLTSLSNLGIGVFPLCFSWHFTLTPNLTLHVSPVLNPYTIMSNHHWVQTWILLSETLSWQSQHYNRYSVQFFDCFQMCTQSRDLLYIQNVEKCCT